MVAGPSDLVGSGELFFTGALAESAKSKNGALIVRATFGVFVPTVADWGGILNGPPQHVGGANGGGGAKDGGGANSGSLNEKVGTFEIQGPFLGA